MPRRTCGHAHTQQLLQWLLCVPACLLAGCLLTARACPAALPAAAGPLPADPGAAQGLCTRGAAGGRVAGACAVLWRDGAV